MFEHARTTQPTRQSDVARGAPPAARRRLTVGSTTDPLERVADDAADAVMRSLDRAAAASSALFAGASSSRIARRSADRATLGGGAVVQRSVENSTYGASVSDQDRQLAAAFYAAYDAAVQRAYTYAVSVPSLGALAGLDGRTAHWAKLWHDFVNGGRPKLMAAAFGYVVESLATHPLSDFRPTPPAGTVVYTQWAAGGTRPDLVLATAQGTRHIAWADLTASDSVDHIFAKENWDRHIGTYAEITYPSVTPATLALMRQNKDNTGPLSAAELDERKRAAEAEHALRKQRWAQLGVRYRPSAHSSTIEKYRDVLDLRPDLAREYIRRLLVLDFGGEAIDAAMVPSILQAMRVNATLWEYTAGFSVSERAGEAWLIDHDPSWNPDVDHVVQVALWLRGAIGAGLDAGRPKRRRTSPKRDLGVRPVDFKRTTKNARAKNARGKRARAARPTRTPRS
jgi:hypothetical protein